MTSLLRKKVYEIARNIPSGKVVTYGQLARYAGKPKAARIVGYYMKHNPDMKKVPCHRVVAFDGSLCGYSGKGGIRRKKEILESEGVVFVKGKVDLSLSLWKPDK